MVGDFFRMPVRDRRVRRRLAARCRTATAGAWAPAARAAGALGRLDDRSGSASGSRQHKFRIVLGPLSRAQFERMLPGGGSLQQLTALVRNYAGDELRWDVRLILDEQTEAAGELGRSARLGWTHVARRAAEAGNDAEDLILIRVREAVADGRMPAVVNGQRT